MSSAFFKRGWQILLAVLVVIALTFYFRSRASDSTSLVTAKLTTGPIVRSVIATGTVNPVTTVQVGSYVSGPIQAIYSDFNSPVRAGQLIAKIDPRPFEVKVDEAAAALAHAKAALAKDQADMAYKKITYQRDGRLFEAEAVSQDTVDSARSSYLQDKAQVELDRADIQQQQANLHDAQVNLNYTNIISPVDGTIVSRNVDVGQTVAASFQTPTLFLIAKDLTKMQVDTNVSESDIGNLHTGQNAEFRVDAFPDREFEGTVGQVRQAPITVQNVVTYDVVVDVPNPELLLKPGMTANVTIVTAKRDRVLRVPIQALRFSPKGITSRVATAGAQGDSQSLPNAAVWVESNGSLRPVSVTIGLSDGNYAEVLSGGLKPGDAVAVDQASSANDGAATRPHMPFFFGA